MKYIIRGGLLALTLLAASSVFQVSKLVSPQKVTLAAVTSKQPPVSVQVSVPTTSTTIVAVPKVIVTSPQVTVATTSTTVAAAVTTEITNCYVSWTTTQVDPTTGQSVLVNGAYGGNCEQAQELAADYPGSVVTTVTNPMTTGANGE